MSAKRKGWRGESFYHKMAAQGLSPKSGMKRPNHKLHRIKGLVQQFKMEALKSRKMDTRKLFGITGKIAKMGKG